MSTKTHLLLVAALLVAGCHSEASTAPPDAAPVIDAGAPDAALPRRPTRRYYLGRNAERCEVYSIDGDVVSPAERTPCPQELAVGERIRLAGKTCLREGRPDRTQPVVCPGALVTAEEKDRTERDGGVK